MVCQWVDCDRYTVSRRYDRLATFIPLFDRILFLPKDSRRRAVERLDLRAGDRVLDVGCGTGRSLGYLHKAVGPTGRVYGIDISPGMLRKTQKTCDADGWDNVQLMQCDAAAFTSPTPLDGVLFSLSYNTMPVIARCCAVPGHHITLRPHSPAFRKCSKCWRSRKPSLRSYSPRFVGIRQNCWYLGWFLTPLARAIPTCLSRTLASGT